MFLRMSSLTAASLSLWAAMAAAQQAPVPLQQPGAPGQPSKTLSGSPAGTGQQGPTEADVKFMQDMIMHHSQAVEMVALMQGRTTNPQVLALGQRISLSQASEIKFMKLWLGYRDKPLSDGSAMDMNMPGMDMSDMAPMPGMLTPKQMDALRNATGPQFDRLFLSGMIQHHTGALNMVKELFATAGAAQDMQLFDFTADVEVTQQGEIDTMKAMLASAAKSKEKQ
jgi:uncharacterized protein (DUF305 family)